MFKFGLKSKRRSGSIFYGIFKWWFWELVGEFKRMLDFRIWDKIKSFRFCYSYLYVEIFFTGNFGEFGFGIYEVWLEMFLWCCGL